IAERLELLLGKVRSSRRHLVAHLAARRAREQLRHAQNAQRDENEREQDLDERESALILKRHRLAVPPGPPQQTVSSPEAWTLTVSTSPRRLRSTMYVEVEARPEVSIVIDWKVLVV